MPTILQKYRICIFSLKGIWGRKTPGREKESGTGPKRQVSPYNLRQSIARHKLCLCRARRTHKPYMRRPAAAHANPPALATALLATALLSPVAFAQAPPPDDDRPPTLAELSETARENIGEGDLSWTAMRALLGPDLWDNAAEWLPDGVLDQTARPANPDAPFTAGSMSADVEPGSQPGLVLSDVLGLATRVMSIAGLGLLCLFGIFAFGQTIYGAASQGQPGWSLPRLGLSFAFLAPIGDQGYCLIQGIQVVCIQISLGLANMVWGTAIDGLEADFTAPPAVQLTQEQAGELAATAIAVGACEGLTGARDGECGGYDAKVSRDRRDEVKRALGGALAGLPGTGSGFDIDAALDTLKAREDKQSGHFGALSQRVRELLLGGRDVDRRLTSPSTWDGFQTCDEVAAGDPGGRERCYRGQPLRDWVVQVPGRAGGPRPGRPGGQLAGQASFDVAAIETASQPHPVAVSSQTLAAWWLLGVAGGPERMAECLAAWAGPDWAAEAARVVQAPDSAGLLEGDRITVQNWLGRAPRAAHQLWLYTSFPNALTAAAGRTDFEALCAPGEDFTPGGWAEYRTNIHEEFNRENQSIAEQHRELGQAAFNAMMGPFVGEKKNGAREGGYGWMAAGASYLALVSANQTAGLLAPQPLALVEIDMDGWGDYPTLGEACADPLEKKSPARAKRCERLRAYEFGMYIAHAAEAAEAGERWGPDDLVFETAEGGQAEPDPLPGFMRAANVLMGGAIRNAADGDSPVLSLMNTGESVLGWGMGVWGVGAAAGAASWMPGAGKWVQPVGAFFRTVGLALMFLGLLLFVWVPALPFLAWLSSVWAWLVSVVMGLMAMPLWAVAHAIPDRGGLLSGYSRAGYQLVLFTMLRPMFLTVGLLFAMTMVSLIARIGAVLINLAAHGWNAANDATGTVSAWIPTNAIGQFAFYAVLLIFLTWLITRTFTLCYELPDRVFEWVGGTRSLGDNEMLDRGRQFLVMGWQRAGGYAQGAMAAANRRGNNLTRQQVADMASGKAQRLKENQGG